MNRSLPLTLRTRLRNALIQLALLPALLLQPLAYAQTESLNRERDRDRERDTATSNGSTGAPRSDSTPSGPARLRQADETRPGDGDKRGSDATNKDPKRSAPRIPPTLASEFEAYVQQLAEPVEIHRFGSDLMTAYGLSQHGGDFNPLVPADYLVQPGDELSLSIWGTVDADLRLVVDRSGRIQIPRVGTIMVSGVRYADLPALISRRVATVFKNFELSVTLGQLRGVRVYVTGFVVRPGALHGQQPVDRGRRAVPCRRAVGSRQFPAHPAATRRRGGGELRPVRPAAQGRPLGGPAGAWPTT